ncbi:MAG TPA: serine/threonine-protein kinase, partial [Anaerolineae bacterium]|nr:serine/threonine-protein kinase [Anaerolineae bacterium]
MIQDPLIGKQLANYRLDRVLGQGGMARVYYAWDIKLDRPVAIKVIDARYRDNPTYAERFIREAQAISSWRHPNIVQIYYADDQDGLYYFAMEYIEGYTLEDHIEAAKTRNKLMDADDIIRITTAVASALDYAHKNGVIHRDIKPANIMLANDGRVILTDFGLALDVEQGTTGEVFGSANYIAPEQARSSSTAVPQSDIYALGIILYEMLTGQLPFNDPSPTAVAIQHITQPPPPPRSLNPDLSAATADTILHALNKEPNQRPKNATQLINDLKSTLINANPAMPAIPPTTHTTTPPTAAAPAMDDNQSNQRLYQIGGLLLLFLTLALAFFWFRSPDETTIAVTATPAVTTTAVTSATTPLPTTN